MIAYYLFAFAFLAAVVLLAVRQNKRRADAAYAEVRESLRKWAESTPPLPPYVPAPIDGDDESEDEPDLSDAALRPIAPLLMRVAQGYLDKPTERERLVRSLTEALNVPAAPSPAA